MKDPAELRAIIERIGNSGVKASVMAKVFPESRTLHLDFETASEIDLRKAGASAYAKHVSTMVLTMSWAFGDDPVKSLMLHKRCAAGLPSEVLVHLQKDGKFAAWNAAFEWAILTSIFGVSLKPEQAVCTMQRALYAGLPGKLETAGAALNLPIVKDMAGHRLMMAMCKPRKDGSFWHQDPIEGPPKMIALAKYCDQDVEAERAIGKMVPILHPYEQRVSLLDRVANNRGIRIDLPLVGRLIDIAALETRKLDAECKALTKGKVTSPGTQPQRLLSWLWDNGIKIPDLTKDTVAETLDTAVDADLPELAVQVLLIRQKVAKSSVKKLQAMFNSVDPDGRVRNVLQYYGALRTGRFSGRLIQPQNFPRPPKGYKPDDAIRDILFRDYDNTGLSMFYEEPLSVVSACLRGCLIPGDGKLFTVFDLSQIEARVLAWLSGQNDILDVFASGDDVYTYTADKTGFPGNRQAGKVMVLGLGFGMGHEAFVAFAKKNGLILSKMQAEAIVHQWRDANPDIRKFWWDLDAAAKSVIGNPSAVSMSVRNVVLNVVRSYGNPVMKITLPSGRPLYYRNPRLVSDPVQSHHTAIVYDGVDPYSKQWGAVRTWGSKLAENVTQAVARDVIVEAALRVSEGFVYSPPELVLSVHDELLWEDDEYEAQQRVDAVKRLVEQRPPWAQDLPVACEGGVVERYGKA